jgi:hypothetical protein
VFRRAARPDSADHDAAHPAVGPRTRWRTWRFRRPTASSPRSTTPWQPRSELAAFAEQRGRDSGVAGAAPLSQPCRCLAGCPHAAGAWALLGSAQALTAPAWPCFAVRLGLAPRSAARTRGLVLLRHPAAPPAPPLLPRPSLWPHQHQPSRLRQRRSHDRGKSSAIFPEGLPRSWKSAAACVRQRRDHDRFPAADWKSVTIMDPRGAPADNSKKRPGAQA